MIEGDLSMTGEMVIVTEEIDTTIEGQVVHLIEGSMIGEESKSIYFL